MIENFKERRNRQKRNGVGVGLAIGIALGVALGTATNNMGFLPIGIALGLSLGAAFSKKRRGDDENQSNGS